jgi:hypothetical protein
MAGELECFACVRAGSLDPEVPEDAGDHYLRGFLHCFLLLGESQGDPLALVAQLSKIVTGLCPKHYARVERILAAAPPERVVPGRMALLRASKSEGSA